MLPEISDLEFNTAQSEETVNVGTSFLFDFEANDFVVKDGRLIKITGTDALKVWIEKIIRTEKNHYKIYQRDDQNEYGVTIEDLLVGNDYSQAFVESELQREISEALSKHPQIHSIGDFTVEKNNPVVNVSFTVILSDGTTVNEEVTFNV